MILTKIQTVLFNLIIAAAFTLIGMHAEAARAQSIPCVNTNAICNSLIPFMQHFNAGLDKFEIIDKLAVAPAYMAIILRSTGAPPEGTDYESFWSAESFGVFIVDSVGNHVLTLDIFPTKRMLDYSVNLGEHGDDYLVITGAGSTYGDESMKRKYFFDLKNRKILSSITEGIDVDITHIIEFNGVIYCVGNTDAKTAVIAKIAFPLPSKNKIEVVTTIQNEKIETILDAKIDNGRLAFTSKSYRYVLNNNAWEKEKNAIPEKYQYNTGSGQFIGLPDVHFWVPAYQVQQQAMEIKLDGKMHRFLVWNSKISINGGGPAGSGIYDIQETSANFYPLPQPSYKLFRQLRQERVEDGYTEEHTSLETEIGSSQLDGGQIRFGLGFYDGEGTSGIGGIGSFDIQSKKFGITYLEGIADSSVYSMLVESNSIWLGLGGQPEGEVYPQGMAKVNRKDNSLARYEIPGLVNSIVRVGRAVYAGTSEGVVVFGDDGGIENIKFSINKDGSYGGTINKMTAVAMEFKNKP